MKQLLILSGKGGTGKTTIASAFIKLSGAKAYADCDVDAPNLHLITKQSSEPVKKDYYGMPKAEINPEICIGCGRCRESCRFDAINKNRLYKVNSFACEGCGVCKAICPVDAVTLNLAIAGDLILYTDERRVFSTALLKMGSGTSGKLVSEVKGQLKKEAANEEFAIIDGSPGIGCPVIASLSGVNMVLIVTEPSISGISDMERIIKTAANFRTKTAVCINKFDTNHVNTEKIVKFCMEQNIPMLGKIPFDYEAVKAINNGHTIVDYNCPSGNALRTAFEKTMELFLENAD